MPSRGGPVRLLWLSKETPDRLGQGGQRRQYFQIRELVAAGVAVTVLIPRGDQDTTSIQDIAEVEFLGGSRWSRLGRPMPALRIIRSGRFDGAVVAHGESFELVQSTGAPLPVPCLLDFHNVNSRWYEVLDDAERTAYWRREEGLIMSAMSAVLACSQRDLTALPAGSAVRALAPNGVDLDEWPWHEHPPGTAEQLVAYGSWWYPSNRKGMSWFVSEVWPLVRDQVPTARLALAGSGTPPDDVLAAPGVAHVGRVDDIGEFLRTGSAIVMPVLQSPGTPVKFAEALASGTALVATTDAAAGFPHAPSLVTDDPHQFAASCTALLTDAVMAARLAADARAYASAHCQWSTTQQPLIDWAARLASPT